MNAESKNEDCRECLQITNDGRNAFLLKTAEKLQSSNLLIGGVLPQDYKAPMFPGDLADNFAKWVIDSAIAVDNIYPSQFFFFLFGGPMFRANFLEDKDGVARKIAINSVFEEIDRFSQYWKEKRGENLRVIIVGTGDIVEFTGYIDLMEIMSEFPEFTLLGFEGYAGVYFDNLIKKKHIARNAPIFKIGARSPKSFLKFTEKEKKLLSLLKDHKSIEKVLITSDLIKGNTPISPEFIARAPDLIIKAQKGKIFVVHSMHSRKLYKIHGYESFTGYQINKIWDTSLALKSLTDIFRSAVLNLKVGPTLVAVIEGTGPLDFPNLTGKIENLWGGLPYGDDYNFFRTINTGKSAFDTPIPYGVSPQILQSGVYPYSWGTPPISETIGSDLFPETLNKRSIAIGARSLYLHMVSGCDISIEPWIRDRLENGVFYVLNKSQIERKAKNKKEHK